MESEFHSSWLRGFLAAFTTWLAVWGYVHVTPAYAGTLAEGPASPGEGVVMAQRGDEGGQRYYRDESGKLYYVDQNGALHTVREKVRVKTEPGGLYSVIDDDHIQYDKDNTGRLYYMGSDGKRVYLEESGPGQVIDPLSILGGTGLQNKLESGRSMAYCDSEWKKCKKECVETPALINKKDCIQNCDYQKSQCLHP